MQVYDECSTNIGQLRFIMEEDGTLKRVLLNGDLWCIFVGNKLMQQSLELGEPVRRQFQEYLNGDRKQFDLEVEPEGTPFQNKVWHALQYIPYGKTKSYSEIASSIGQPDAVRAVGHANGKKPLPIVYPCHRVIGKNNNLTGYAGGIDMKKQLLQIEGVEI